MTIEKGCLRDWDDRHYQSIDDLPPEAWDAVWSNVLKKDSDIALLESVLKNAKINKADDKQIANAIIELGFKRD